jgi:hypothetical protein
MAERSADRKTTSVSETVADAPACEPSLARGLFYFFYFRFVLIRIMSDAIPLHRGRKCCGGDETPILVYQLSALYGIMAGGKQRLPGAGSAI